MTVWCPVNGAYHYATTPLSALNEGNSFFIVGAYDGSCAVRLWVDNLERTPSASITGGVTRNNSPVVIGPDPQGTTDCRYFFRGKIQQVQVQRWRDHGRGAASVRMRASGTTASATFLSGSAILRRIWI